MLVWLALVTQIGAPALAAIAMAGPADALAGVRICTSEGRPSDDRRDAPPLHNPCCDTLCQIAHASEGLLAPSVAEAPPVHIRFVPVEIEPAPWAPERRAVRQPNARAPPPAFLIA